MYCEIKPKECDCIAEICGKKRPTILSKAGNRFLEPDRPLLIISEADLLAIKKAGKFEALVDFGFEIRSTAQVVNMVSKAFEIKVLPN